MTFDEHRAACGSCNKGPYALCPAGADPLIAEGAARPRDALEGFRPWTQRQIAAYVAGFLREKCGACSEPLIVHRGPSGLNILCPKRLEPPMEEALKHSYNPIDTGPFSLGRRVD